MIKLIVLDRDGVINEDSPDYIRSPDAWHALPKALAAIAKLKDHGYKVAIATNQSGVGRGYYSLETLDLIHKKMLDQVQKAGGTIDAIFVCPHSPEDNCDCRKPKSGMLLQAANQFNIAPEEIIMVGDATRDILAAKNCGAQAIFIKSNNKEKDFLEVKKSETPIYDDLAAVVDAICKQK